jgi:DNA polymerase III sliding clamp (beta) subunit (PCNA family)
MTKIISINAGELKSALAGFSKIINTRHSLEALCSLRIRGDETGLFLEGTDSESHLKARIGNAEEPIDAFLVPFGKLKEFVRRLPSHALVRIAPECFQSDLGTGTLEERFEVIDPTTFPEEPNINAPLNLMPTEFVGEFRQALGCSSDDQGRPILNGVLLDLDQGMHRLISTDGRHLYRSGALNLSIAESFVIPALPILAWKGLGDDWAIAVEKKDRLSFRIRSGIWEITSTALEGNYPNWRAVLPASNRTLPTLPESHSFKEALGRFPKDRQNSIRLVIEKDAVSLVDGISSTSLTGVITGGPDAATCLNRDYLAKAFDYGLTTIGLTDPTSALHFRSEGRQMVIMPIRRENQPQAETPTPPTEQKPNMTATITNGAAAPHISGNREVPVNGSIRNIGPVSTTTSKPAIEVAIDNLDSFKSNLREALGSISEITALLRQAIRDQRANEREIQSVRQTLRSLQGVRI